MNLRFLRQIYFMKLARFLLCFLFLSYSALKAESYYFDSSIGKDSNHGLSPEFPFKTLKKLNQLIFKPGDQILLRSGSVFYGQIKPKGSGSLKNPILLSSYQAGNKPIIDAQGKFESTLFIENISHWIVENLEIVNFGEKPEPGRMGIYLLANQGEVQGLVIRELLVRDVNGVISRTRGNGFGLRWSTQSHKIPSRFNGLIIENCHFLRCDRNAIEGTLWPIKGLKNLSVHVVIRNNLIEDVGGDAIVVIGCDGALVEKNRVYGARKRFDTQNQSVVEDAGPSIGIWPWSSINTRVQFNEVWGYKGIYDGQGFDSDFNCDGSLFEYNFSGENEGGFFLICNNEKWKADGRSIGNKNTVVRHNISFNDRKRGFVIDGSVKNVMVRENIIYNNIDEVFSAVIETSKNQSKESIQVLGNYFYTTGKSKIHKGKWAGKHSVGEWLDNGPINSELFLFKENSYTYKNETEELGVKTLKNEETILSLIHRFKKDKDVYEGFFKLIDFMKDSKKWHKLDAQFPVNKDPL